MREAVGSTFLFKLMIFFIFFFASFLALAINYSQAFSFKNQIINILEKQEGLTNNTAGLIIDKALEYGYYRDVPCNTRNDDGVTISDGTRSLNGVCIKKLPNDSTASLDSRYYRVTTYISFKFPIIGRLFTLPVVGETKVIKHAKED